MTERPDILSLAFIGALALSCGGSNSGGGDVTDDDGGAPIGPTGTGGTATTDAARGTGGKGGSTGGPGGSKATGGSTTAGGSTGTGGGGATGAKSAGCGKPMPYDPNTAYKPEWLFWGMTDKGDLSLPVTVGGSTRHFGLYVPGGYDESTAWPLVMGIHGCTGDDWADQGGVQSAASDQAIFVFPKGDLHPCGGGGGWDWSPGSADFDYIDAVLAEVESKLCIDTTKVFEYGFSMGGFMSNALGCYRGSGVYRAVSPEEGGQPQWTNCKGPEAVLIIHGDADGAVSIDQGRAARDHWQKANGCATTTKPWDPAPCVLYDGCPADKPVGYCEIPGLGHVVWEKLAAATWKFYGELMK